MRKDYALVEGRIVERPPSEAPISVFVAPGEAERRFLIDELRLDEYDLNSATDPDELSRLELAPNYVAVINKRPRNYSSADRLLFRVNTYGIFLLKDRLVLVLPEDVPIFDGGRLVFRLGTLVEVMLRVLYRTAAHFLGHLRAINAAADELEQKINTSMGNRYLLGMFTLEKSLVYLQEALQSNGMMIEKLRSCAAKLGFRDEEVWMLEEIQVENQQCAKQAEIASQVLSSLMDARASIVGNNLNLLMRNLTLLMIAMMWPTAVCGFFSMNVKLPVDQSNNHWIFWMIILASVGPLIAGGIWYWHRRQRKRKGPLDE